MTTGASPDRTPTYRSWAKLPDNRLGHALFSLGMVAKVPYFGTVNRDCARWARRSGSACTTT
ncbi:Uncharacterised protein [Mycobacteroides abscessus subsp. abscessus]|nr:Uncharacterised protein [Mycobacteroides abscessus subsp. abscessus]